MAPLSPRQIHLDFHTSEAIPGIGERFDPAAFAQTAADAHVSSMTVFARCHHGWLYYDSQRFPELVHPQLARRNLLPEQVAALHAKGIRAPVYITVQWDYHLANTRPEWLIRRPDGVHEGPPFTQAGFYQSLCLNTEYVDFLKAQTEEVMDLLGDELDGLFFDIVGIRPCWCATCRADMRARGIDMHDDAQVRAFAKVVNDRFRAEMSAFIRARRPDCTIFYNAGHVGPCTRDSAGDFSHFELESLPSGGWGYLHFPATARYARKLGLDCMGMTGKFHTSWGDFHSLKNLEALEFEAFRMLSYGFACSIGDQLEPNGALNPATYGLIGKVYGRFEACEPWGRPSRPLIEAAVLTSEDPFGEHRVPDSILGACQLLEELSLQFDILDETMPLDGYRLVILPDDFTGGDAFHARLDAYIRGGGRVLAFHHGGLRPDGTYPASFGATYAGENACYPDFIVAEGPLAADLVPENEYAIYMQGARLEAAGATPALCARAPYFPRTAEHFCSHRYTPSAKGEPYPVALRNGNVLLMGHPLLKQYRDCAPGWVKALVKNALDSLLPERLVAHDGPSTVSIQLLEQPEQNRAVAHILTYTPVRKSATIDIIEDRAPVHGLTVTVSLPRPVRAARLVPEGTPLAYEGGRVTIPVVDGYAIVEYTYEG